MLSKEVNFLYYPLVLLYFSLDLTELKEVVPWLVPWVGGVCLKLKLLKLWFKLINKIETALPNTYPRDQECK